MYCDIEGSNRNGEGGWMRVAFVSMSEPGSTSLIPTCVETYCHNGIVNLLSFLPMATTYPSV